MNAKRFWTTRVGLLPLTALLSLAMLSACDDTVDFEPTPDAGDDVIDPPVETFDEWVTYEPEGATCADGTQYRYFVKERENSDNVLVLFEGGGACWGWESCTGSEGQLGALGVDCVMRNYDENYDPVERDADDYCIPENYADTYFGIPGDIDLSQYEALIPDYVHFTDNAASIDTALPLGSSNEDVSPFHDWNLVFMPYCTADLYAGDRDATYVNPENPEQSIEFLHRGLDNTLIVAEELNERFGNIPQFAMNGCSAGGAGVVATYYFFRTRMTGIGQGFVFSDAGPLFPDREETSRSLPLHDTVRESWSIDNVFELFVNETDLLDEAPDDIADLYDLLSEQFPNDRFSIAFTQTDFNYSLYSYTDFYEAINYRARTPEERALVYEYWNDDLDLLIDRLDGLDNMYYYFPFWRRTNDSHCISIAGFEDAAPNGDLVASFIELLGDPASGFYAGTEIQVEGGETPDDESDDVFWNYGDHVRDVLNSASPASVYELEPEGPFAPCTPAAFDEEACEAAVNGD